MVTEGAFCGRGCQLQPSNVSPTQVHQRQMIGEIALTDVEGIPLASASSKTRKPFFSWLMKPISFDRQGVEVGARDRSKTRGDFLIVTGHHNPKEAYGANIPTRWLP